MFELLWLIADLLVGLPIAREGAGAVATRACVGREVESGCCGARDDRVAVVGLGASRDTLTAGGAGCGARRPGAPSYLKTNKQVNNQSEIVQDRRRIHQPLHHGQEVLARARPVLHPALAVDHLIRHICELRVADRPIGNPVSLLPPPLPVWRDCVFSHSVLLKHSHHVLTESLS